MNADIAMTLITDSTAGAIMGEGKVDMVIVGTDRVAANGDTANKIGTYALAVLAHAHDIPFYVAAPLSSIDMNIESGDDIPIEERNGEELTHINGSQIAPDKVETYMPAFDVTPHRFITGFVTEKGIVKPDFREHFKKLFES